MAFLKNMQEKMMQTENAQYEPSKKTKSKQK